MPTDIVEQSTQTQNTGQTVADQSQKPDSSQKPDGQQSQQPKPQQASTQRPGADQTPGDDARSRGMLADLQKERLARQKLQSQFDQLSGQREADQRRIKALAGVDSPSAEEAELSEVRARLIQVFPALGKLSEEKLETLLSLSESSQGIQEATQHHWAAHGRSMLDSLTNTVAEEIGGDLTDRQKNALARAYTAEAEADPEFLKRHEAGDTKLVAEFAKQWIEDWFEPVRKQVISQEVSRRRPVPNGRDRNVQTTPAKKVDFKDPKAVEDAMVESFKSHGGRFES